MAKAPRDRPDEGAFNPESVRMSIGQHLEELRIRVVLGLFGFVAAAVVCFIFGNDVVIAFCRPLMKALEKNNLSPQVYTSVVDEAFLTYIKISLICAAALASPWMLYQIWKFVSAGLYPRERKYVTKYLPLSVGLLITGMLFLYFFVLPVMLDLFISFQIGPAVNFGGTVDKSAATRPAVIVPTLQGDPESPQQGQIWFDQTQRRIKVSVMGEVRVLTFASENLVTPHIMLRDYVDMVVGLLLSFGLAFQMPLVVLALTRIGIMEISTLRSWRRPMYLGMVVVAACIVPDVVTGMIALAVPLVLLYEFGILLSVMAERKAKQISQV